VLNPHAVLRAFYSPGRVEIVGHDSPQRHK
jgi:hypothetical protein